MKSTSVSLGLALCLWGAACGPDPVDPPPVLAEGIFGALGEPVEFATVEQLAAFDRGAALARRFFTPEDGLGPLFNVASCGSCHEKPVIGGSAGRYRDFYLAGSVLEDGSFIQPPNGGILHSYGNGDQLPRPGLGGVWNVQARRSPIPFFGVGLLAEVEESAILANADPDDRDGDGISGRPNYDGEFVGRFGRKAQTVSIEGFIRGPLNNHIGITSDPLSNELRAQLPVDSSIPDAMFGQRGGALASRRLAQAAPPSEPLFDDDAVADPELSSTELFDIVSFAMLQAAPQPSAPTPETEHGRALFSQTQCDRCHVPTLESPRGLIPAYSDLLLHDMGAESGDGLQQGLATSTEFRTQPLWGVAAVAPYLHDGRADTLDEAIRDHDGEAAASRDAYLGLTSVEQADVVAFLESLGGIDQRSDGLLPPDAPIGQVGTYAGPARALEPGEAETFAEGRRLFDRDQYISDGLGPNFNGDSCRACHFAPDVAGAGPIDVNVMRHTTIDAATGIETVPAIGTMLHKLTLPGVPRIEPAVDVNTFEPRQTPHAYGLGMIDAIADTTIEANADPDDVDGDGISGRISRVPGDRIGRFGWKAQVPSIREFVRDAMGAEVGMTVPVEDGQSYGAFADGDDVADPELSTDDLDALEFYLAMLAPPPRVENADAIALFDDIGCAACHVVDLPSPLGDVRLYSDLLLHDVAPESYVGLADFTATGREFRTPPLWGLGSTAPYMHDGSASSVEASIAAHFAEGAQSVAAFNELDDGEKAALIAFLESL